MEQPIHLKQCFKVANQASYAFYNKYYYLPMIEPEEVKAEAYLAMVEAILTFDPTRGRKIESWVVFITKRHLRKKFLRRERFRRIYLENFDTFISDKHDLERIILFKDAVQNLSPLPKEILEILNEGKMQTRNDKKNTIKREIRRVLRERGYGIQRIKKAFRELKEVATMPI